MDATPPRIEAISGAAAGECYTQVMAGIEVVFLGSGDAFSAAGRHQAGYLVRAGGQGMLLDCGATTLAALKRASIDADAVDTVFISHLHGDHFAGLPFLFLQYTYAAPRRRPLRIAGPPGTEERVRDLYRAMYRDASERPLPFEVDYSILWPGRRVEIGAAAVDPFRVPHQENDISLGLQLTVGGRGILYSGDTGWTEELVNRSQQIDLFICECSFYETRMSTHLDYPRLSENRERFGAGRIVLTHLGREVLLRRDRIELQLAFDGMRVEVG